MFHPLSWCTFWLLFWNLIDSLLSFFFFTRNVLCNLLLNLDDIHTLYFFTPYFSTYWYLDSFDSDSEDNYCAFNVWSVPNYPFFLMYSWVRHNYSWYFLPVLQVGLQKLFKPDYIHSPIYSINTKWAYPTEQALGIQQNPQTQEA